MTKQPRIFGRVDDDTWRLIKTACKNAGQSVVAWALPTLVKKAKRELEGKGK